MNTLEPAPPPVGTDVLERIQERVLWLAVRMVDHANRGRPDAGGIKVGGHQASSASMVGIMTALWFGHLRGVDKVAVKPHASPVYHAIKYLTGELDRSQLTRLRAFGGLQAYPSRTKDPDVVDYSTGSVGLGAVAPLFSAAVRRYVDAHFGPRPGPDPRFIALVGDAELDEGNVWEAIADPVTDGLGRVMLVVDLNRQSLDRVVPGLKAHRLMRFFADAGWHVEEAKYGGRLEAAFSRPGGEALRAHLDAMANEDYQRLFALEGPDLRDHLLFGADPAVRRLCAEEADDDLAHLVQNLGGHDLAVLTDRYRRCDLVTDRPSVVFAYTVKGWGLPIAGDPMNHAALLTEVQIDDLRASAGLHPDDEWDPFPTDSAAGRLCALTGAELNNVPPPPRPRIRVPASVGPEARGPSSTQEAFGRVLTALGRDPEVAAHLVTTSPDVSVSTNLGGWINQQGVFAPMTVSDEGAGERVLAWRQGPDGRHLELGISEMNLFLLLSQLGLSHDHHGEALLPIGTVYDPFVCRGLDALVYALYNDARFVVVGTPSGISLAPEGGAHQSTITASIGVELPGLTLAEPAYGPCVDWLLCDGLARLSEPDGGSLYLRLSTRPIDPAPFLAARDRLGGERLRRDVLAGGYRLVEPDGGRAWPGVVFAASGAVMPEAVEAARLLGEEEVASVVIDVTSLGRLFAGWRQSQRRAAQQALAPRPDHHLARLVAPAERTWPIVTVHDASSHAMAWLGSVFGTRVVPVGVDGFGQSGTINELYSAFDLLPEQLVNAALVSLA